MKALRIGCLTAVLLAIFGIAAFAEVDAGNKTCPVSGKAVNPKITAVYEGKRHAFCCKSCLKDFEKDPAKYVDSEAGEGEHSHTGHDHSHEH